MQPGERFGPYDIIDVLGEGGMGVVYRARDSRLGREVAIKTMPASSASDPVRLQRFQQEAQAASSLNHPNVLSIFDVGQQGSTPYLVTELLDGQTLRDRLKDGPLPPSKAIELAVGIANGLAAVHEKGIVHRDLKPENVFVTRDGRVKILDFGVARMLESTTPPTGTLPLTQEGAVMGTAGYMSPEQVRGRPADARSDLFALGAILYELVTGHLAFAGDTPVERGYAILNKDAPPLDAPNPALERVIRRCLEKAPDQRFQHARDLAFALEAITDAGRPSGVQPALAPPRSSAALVPWLVAGAAVLVALAVTFTPNLFRPRTRDLPPVPAKVNVTVPPEGLAVTGAPKFTRVNFRNGWVGTARFAGEKNVVYSGAFEGEPPTVVTGVIGSADTRAVATPFSTLFDVARGEELAIGQVDANPQKRAQQGTLLSRASLAGGAPRPILENVAQAQFGPGTSMLVVRKFGTRFTLEYPVGRELVARPSCICSARLSPDGKLIAFADQLVPFDDRGSVVIIDSATGKELERSRQYWSIEGLAWTADGAEVWFTASDVGTLRAIRSLATNGHERDVFAAPGTMRLHDIDGDGRVLAAMRMHRQRIFGRVGDSPRERPLSHFDGSMPADLARDGSALLFIEGMGSNNVEIETYWRRFDQPDTSPVRLSSGWGRALSPDLKWAVVSPVAPFTTLSLVPTGPGVTRELPAGDFRAIATVRYFRDGKRIAITGRGPDEKYHLYVQNLPVDGVALAGDAVERAKPRQLSDDELVLSAPPSPDGKTLAALTIKQEPVLVSVESGEVKPIAGLAQGDMPMEWADDGKSLLVARRAADPSRLMIELSRFDFATKKRAKVLEVGPSDTVGMTEVGKGIVTPDAKHYVYQVHQSLDELYVIDGLK